MQLFFRILSIIYVAAIFLLADSSVTKNLASFNRYSLLHIPLYGIMSLLLFFSIAPVKRAQIPHRDVSIQTPPINPKSYCFIAGLIALGVAIADEYHQSFISIRLASESDVFLDLVGISLSMVLIFRFYKNYSLEEGFRK
jgi:hypothetical protein